MRGSPCQVKGVFDKATSVKPLGDGREVVPLLSSIQHNSKFGTVQRGRKRPEASLLYQLSIPGSRSKLPKDGKDSFRIISRLKKTSSLFQAHPIVVMIDHPIRKTMNKIDATGRLIQWAIELGQFYIKYQPRATIKAQVLVDFIAEFIYPYKEEKPPWKHGRSKRMGQPRRKWDEQE